MEARLRPRSLARFFLAGIACTFALGTAHADYPHTIQNVQRARTRARTAYRSAKGDEARKKALAAARSEVHTLIVDDIIPAWFGTKWDFNGTSQVPGEGEIACGYFVSTVLRDAGFDVQRIKLAQQAAEKIVLTLSETDEITRLSRPSREEVVRTVREAGDGLYVVGLDFHVGFLVADGDRVDFCHSSYVDPPLAVVCQDALTDPALASDYYVIGRILSDEMMEAWLTKAPIRVQ